MRLLPWYRMGTRSLQESGEWGEEPEGAECPRCKCSCIALKALKLLSEGEVGH